MLMMEIASLTNKMACALIVNGQVSNSIGYVCYAGSVSHVHRFANASIANLKFVPEFLLDPSRQLWLRAAIDQEHVVLEIQELREDRGLLTNLFRIFWRPPVYRDELQFCRVDEAASFSDILTSEFGPPQEDAARTDGQHGLRPGITLVFCPHPGNSFPHKLGVFCQELESGGGLFQILGKVYPERTSLMDEKRMDHGVRHVSSQQGFPLLFCEIDAYFAVPQQCREPAESWLSSRIDEERDMKRIQ